MKTRSGMSVLRLGSMWALLALGALELPDQQRREKARSEDAERREARALARRQRRAAKRRRGLGQHED